jgi:hypothetical protein
MTLLFLQEGRYLLVQEKYRVRVFDIETRERILSSASQFVGIASDSSALLLKSDERIQVALLNGKAIVDYTDEYEPLFPTYQCKIGYTNFDHIIIENVVTGEKIKIRAPSTDNATSEISRRPPVTKLLEIPFIVFETSFDTGWGESAHFQFYDLRTDVIRFEIYNGTYGGFNPLFVSQPHSIVAMQLYSEMVFYDLNDGLKLGKLHYLSLPTGTKEINGKRVHIDRLTGKAPDNKQLHSIAIHPLNKRRIALGVDLHLHLVDIEWDAEPISDKRKFKLLPFELFKMLSVPIILNDLKWSPDGNMLAIANDEGTVYLFDSQTSNFERLS